MEACVSRLGEWEGSERHPLNDSGPVVAAIPGQPSVSWCSNRNSQYSRSTWTKFWEPIKVLQPDTLIDRYGTEEGTFASRAGTSFEQRVLPYYYQQTKALSTYGVVSPLGVDAGVSAPAFGMPGLGIQYELPETVAKLLESGVLVRAS